MPGEQPSTECVDDERVDHGIVPIARNQTNGKCAAWWPGPLTGGVRYEDPQGTSTETLR